MKALLFFMLIASTAAFGFEEYEEYEEEKRNQETEQENRKNKQRNYQEEDQLFQQQPRQDLLIRKNSKQQKLQQEYEK